MKRLLVVAVLAGSLVVAASAAALAFPPGHGMSGYGPGMMQGGMGPGMGMGPGAAMGFNSWQAVEKLLGMTFTQIQAERLAGKSLVQIAQGKSVTEQKLVSTILEARKADLDRLVAAGRLTKAQADFMYQQMQQHVPVMVNQAGMGPAGAPGRGPMGPGRFAPQGGRGPGACWGNP